MISWTIQLHIYNNPIGSIWKINFKATQTSWMANKILFLPVQLAPITCGTLFHGPGLKYMVNLWLCGSSVPQHLRVAGRSRGVWWRSYAGPGPECCCLHGVSDNVYRQPWLWALLGHKRDLLSDANAVQSLKETTTVCVCVICLPDYTIWSKLRSIYI